MPAAMPPPSARSTLTVIFAAAFSAATSACAGGAPPSKIVSVRSPMVLLQAFEELGAAPGIDAVGQPGDLASPVAFRKRSMAGRVSTRSIGIGFWRKLAQRHARGAARHDA